MRESHIRVPADREILDMECRCCGEKTVRLIIDLGDQPLCNRLVRPETPVGSEPVYPLRLGRCENCTLLQIDHTIPRNDMFREYVYVSGTTESLRRHFARATEWLRAVYSVTKDDLVVDIGSNDGTWLATWGRWQRHRGVEPARNLIRQSVENGVHVMNAYFDLETAKYLRRNDGAAKLITSAGSFFHMEDLHGACHGVRELLADDGVFVCQAISADDMIAGNAFDQILHEHLCYYSPFSFADLMERHGLELFSWYWLPIHGGTWEYHVRKRRPEIETEHDIPEPPSLVACQDFAHRVLELRSALLHVLTDFRDRRKSVWAYGAPGKGATLLNSFGIDRDLVQWAIEKNPLKFGLAIPGCRIPIVDEASAVRPDAYLVLAWNFLPEFLVKERDWLKLGGQFIVPIPYVRTIPVASLVGG